MSFRNLHPNIKFRLFESSLSSSLGAMIYPFMTIYLADKLGGTLTGILLVVNILFGTIAGFYGGYCADLFGRKKLMTTAELIRLIAVVIMTIANSSIFYHEFWSAIITITMMTTIGMAWTMAFPAHQAMLIDVSNPSERKLIYTIMYWVNNLSVAIGGIIGGLLFKEHLLLLLIGLCIGNATSLIVITFFISETHSSRVKEKINSNRNIIYNVVKNYSVVLKDKVFGYFILASLLILSLDSQLSNYIAVRLNKEFVSQGIGTIDLFTLDGVTMLAVLKAENTLIIVLFMAVVNKVTKKFTEKNLFLSGLTLFTTGYVVLSFTNSLTMLLVFMLLVSVGELVYVPLSESYFANIPSENLRSSYIAAKELVYKGGSFIGATFVILGDHLSKYFIATLLAVMGIVAIFIFKIIIPYIEEREHNQSVENIQ
ncbi:MFS transporter [Priestia flexa]|uniref:MFS transporter n=1 Tax=Priestia flexa TaxID=86664 RepID=UPI000C2303B5|nr:MFS transporter [Priestia flexa]MEC0665824.1 MFS transporter [Priestia flexa]